MARNPGVHDTPRRFGLIGGLSPASTVDYYELINNGVRKRMGGRHTAELLMWSCDMHPVVEAEFAGDWERVGAHLATAARALEGAGCEGLLVACNSVHNKVAFACLRSSVRIPILHIAEVTADALLQADIRRCVPSSMLACAFFIVALALLRVGDTHTLTIITPSCVCAPGPLCCQQSSLVCLYSFR